ncbi:MAG: hypothetical protein N2037_13085, partial [Acidimicrobiales bacterium]|nr:hypothetical protein [Acidimicrobiales bacterium]
DVGGVVPYLEGTVISLQHSHKGQEDLPVVVVRMPASHCPLAHSRNGARELLTLIEAVSDRSLTDCCHLPTPNLRARIGWGCSRVRPHVLMGAVGSAAGFP